MAACKGRQGWGCSCREALPPCQGQSSGAQRERRPAAAHARAALSHCPTRHCCCAHPGTPWPRHFAPLFMPGLFILAPMPPSAVPPPSLPPPFLLPSCPLLPLLPHPPHTSRGFRSTCRPSTSSEEGSARSASTSGVATRPSRKDTCSSLGLRTSTLALVAKLVRASGPDSATCGGCGRVGWAGPDAREEGGRNGGLREYVCPSTAGGNAR